MKTRLRQGYGEAGGPWSSDTVTNSYSNRLRVGLVLQQPTGVWTNQFIYDAARRLSSVTSPAGAFSYTFVGQASRLTQTLSLPNAAYITNTYDVVARLTSTELKNSIHSTLNAHTYVYNPGNQRTQQSFSPSGSTYNYTYDRIGQLKVADSATASEDRGYQYDAAWNLNYRTNSTALKTFSVDGKNQLTSTPEGSCTYDNNGNLTISHGEKRSYVYDDENRLVQLYVSTRVGVLQKATEFVYDGLGRLRVRREYTYDAGGAESSAQGGQAGTESLGGSWALIGETRYVYDGWRVIQERDGSNVPTVSYTRGTDLSGSLEGAGGIGGLLARTANSQLPSASAHAFYHADGNGNITYLVNSSQGLAASYRYDPYGNTISSSGSLASANVYRFSSKEVHTLSGLYYYGERWYEPNFQRWLNRDPLGEPGFELLRRRDNTRALAFKTRVRPNGSNPYEFVRNRPLSYYDPLGLAERGPGTIACQQATEQAEELWKLAESEPGNLELEDAAILASFNAAYWCTPPRPPPTPWWRTACRCVGRGILTIGGACLNAAGALGGLWVLPGQDPTGGGGA